MDTRKFSALIALACGALRSKELGGPMKIESAQFGDGLNGGRPMTTAAFKHRMRCFVI